MNKKRPFNINNYINNMSRGSIEETASFAGKLMTDLTEKYALKTIAGTAAFIGVAAVTDFIMDKNDEKKLEDQQIKQEKQLKKKREESLKYRRSSLGQVSAHAGLVQEMFNQRKGHSNTWGGVRY